MNNVNARATLAVLLGVLLSACASTPRSPIYEAAADGTYQQVEALLAQGADPNAGGGMWGRPLVAAVIKRDLEDPDFKPIVRALLDAGADPNGVVGWRPMVIALEYNEYNCDPELIQMLLDAGADLSFSGGYRDTPLFWAAKKNNLECAHMLIDAGAEINSERTKWGFGNSSITEEMEKNSWDIAALRQRSTTAKQQRLAQVQQEAEAAEQAAAQAQIDAYQARLDATWNRDTSMAPQIRRDKYLIAFSSAMKNLAYEDAHFFAQLLERNGVGIEDSLYYFWGEALLRIGKPDAAIEKLNTYFARTGSTGSYYSQALALMIEAEAI